MAGQTVQIAILADAGRAVADLNGAGTAAKNMGNDFDTASKDVKELGDKMGDGASKSSQFVGGIGDLGGALSEMNGPLGAVGSAMETATPAMMGMVGAFDLAELAANSTALSWIKSTAATVANKVATTAVSVATKAAAAAQWLLNAAMSANPIGLIIAGILLLIVGIGLMVKHWDKVKVFLLATWDIIKAAFEAVWGWIKTAFKVYLQAMAAVGKAIWAGIKAVFVGVWNFLKGAFNTFVTGLKAIWGGIKFLWTFAVSIFNSVKSAFQGPLNTIKGWISNAINNIKSVWGGISVLWTKAKDAVGKAVDYIKGLPGKAVSAIGNIASKFSSIGSDIVSGIRSGISNAWGAFTSWVQEQINKIPKAIRDVLHIGSPSKTMADLVGRPMVEGIKAGFESMSAADIVKPFMRDVARMEPVTVGTSMVGGTALAGGGGGSIVVNVSMGIVGDPAEAGRQVRKVLDEYSKRYGR